jgi:hypothetical protein
VFAAVIFVFHGTAVGTLLGDAVWVTVREVVLGPDSWSP